MDKKKIAVIGSVNMDIVVNVPYMPAVGETILGYSFKTVPGGKGANQAFTAARLNGDVCMVGKVGMDEFAQPLLDNLKRVGVNVDGIKKQEDTHSGLAFIYVSKEGDNNIVVVPGANGRIFKEDLEQYKGLIEGSDIILLQLEIPLDTVFYAIDIAHEMGKFIILNPAPAPDSIPDSVLKKIDIITPNETELQKLIGSKIDSMESIKEGANVLLSKGVKTVVVTLGDKGAALVTENEFLHFLVPKVETIDTTAAGDSFTAAIAVALSEGRSMEEAIIFAGKVASIVVTREGAQTSIPSRYEVERTV